MELLALIAAVWIMKVTGKIDGVTGPNGLFPAINLDGNRGSGTGRGAGSRSAPGMTRTGSGIGSRRGNGTPAGGNSGTGIVGKLAAWWTRQTDNARTAARREHQQIVTDRGSADLAGYHDQDPRTRRQRRRDQRHTCTACGHGGVLGHQPGCDCTSCLCHLMDPIPNTPPVRGNEPCTHPASACEPTDDGGIVCRACGLVRKPARPPMPGQRNRCRHPLPRWNSGNGYEVCTRCGETFPLPVGGDGAATSTDPENPTPTVPGPAPAAPTTEPTPLVRPTPIAPSTTQPGGEPSMTAPTADVAALTGEANNLGAAKEQLAALAAISGRQIAALDQMSSGMTAGNMDPETLAAVAALMEDAAAMQAKTEQTLAEVKRKHDAIEEAINATQHAAKTEFYKAS